MSVYVLARKARRIMRVERSQVNPKVHDVLKDAEVPKLREQLLKEMDSAQQKAIEKDARAVIARKVHIYQQECKHAQESGLPVPPVPSDLREELKGEGAGAPILQPEDLGIETENSDGGEG